MMLQGVRCTKLHPVTEKALLHAIEKRNQHRDETVLSEVCDSNVELFGTPGSQQRKDVQEYWKNAKRRSIRSYEKLLGKWGVALSETTKMLVHAEARMPSPVNSPGFSDIDELCGGMQDSLTLKPFETPPHSKATPGSARAAFGTLSGPTPGSANFGSSAGTSFGRASNPVNNSTWFSNNSPPPYLTSSFDTCSSETFQGSLQNPFVIHADVEKPERSFPFDVVFVPRIEHNGWAREGIDIRINVGVGDAPFWSAWMSSSNSIMVRGRSRSSAYDALQSYHRKEPLSDIAAVHTKVCEEVAKDPSRQALHWKINVGFSLDNMILSGDTLKIVMQETGVTYNAASDEKIKCLAYFVSWRIAIKAKGHQIKGGSKKKLSDAFN